jgi:transcriptional regulator with XRE-family HTH domain
LNRHAKLLADRAAFGQAVQARRVALGLSQNELAELIARDRHTVNKVEAGWASLGFACLFALAEALHTELSVLLRTEAKSGAPND